MIESLFKKIIDESDTVYADVEKLIKKKTNGVQPEKKVWKLSDAQIKYFRENFYAGKPEFLFDRWRQRKINTDVLSKFGVMTCGRENKPKKVTTKNGTEIETIILASFYIPIKVNPLNPDDFIYFRKFYFYEYEGKIEKGISAGGPDKKSCLLGLEYLKPNQDIILSEGEEDYFSLLSNGFNALSHTGGAMGFKPAWHLPFALKNVVILYDDDEPGTDGAIKTAEILSNTANSVKIAHWNSGIKGYDVGDFFKANREIPELQNILNHAIPFSVKTDDNIAEVLEETSDYNRKKKLEEKFYIVVPDKPAKLLQRKVAEYIAKNYDICSTSKSASRKQFYEYKEGFWQKKTDEDIIEIILNLLLHDVTGQQLTSISKILRSTTPVNVPADRFDNYPDLINLNNCIFDLKNYKVIKQSSKYHFTYKNSYNYDPNATCPKFLEALWQYSCAGDAAEENPWIDCLMEILGFCLTGTYHFQKMFWFLGPKGANGKGTVLRVMENLVGSAMTKSGFEAKKLDTEFYRVTLMGKRLAITGDMPPRLINPDILKQMTGGDKQSSNVKYSDEVEFKPTAKLVFAMNKMPELPTGENWQPYKRRLCLLLWDYVISKPDGNIDEIFEGELPGIFNLAIEGLKRLRKNKEFTEVPSSNRAIELYEGNMNTFVAFVSDRCIIDRKASAWSWQIYDAYIAYMKEYAGESWEKNPYHINNQITFGKEMRTKYNITVKDGYCKEKKGGRKKYHGIRLRDSEDDRQKYGDIVDEYVPVSSYVGQKQEEAF